MRLDDALSLLGQYGYLLVLFGVMAESAGVPLPDETVLTAAGVLVHRGDLDPGDVVFFGILGAVVGDQIGYWVGRYGGRAVFLTWFVAGLRVLGALTAAVTAGYLPWESLGLVEHWLGRASLVLVAGLVLIVALRRIARRALAGPSDD